MSDYFVAFAASVFALLLLRAAAPRLRLLDQPGVRKAHDTPVPHVGGLAIYAAVAVAASLDGFGAAEWHLLVAGGLLVLVGTLDDLRGLPPRLRLAAQLVAALIMLSAGHGIHQLGNLFGFGPVQLGAGGLLFTVLCVLALINAMNMVDGLDGLAGGLALIACAYLGFAAWRVGDAQALATLLALAGAVGAFLLFNARYPGHPRAQVFLGDAGSTLLGLVLVWVAVDLAQPGPDAARTVTPLAVVWVLAYPLCEVMTMTVRRLRLGRNPCVASREHTHDILLAAGFGAGRSVALLWAVAALLGAVGVAGWLAGVPEPLLAYGFVALVAGHYALVHHGWRAMRRLRQLREGAQPGMVEPRAAKTASRTTERFVESAE